ncbi:hypothetical protein [Rubrivivax rivuli]|uniref:Uncharacterized protein n=1 Tax=Rubrivivax rivuli TaxID=1862385 RepID=A0A437RK86_9BURK|nr:hypothetical protein [Rubrivivax rivuli]RVU47055.1 hypothetical protein EOE66_04615 [Rubrivivax rivuli]
MEMIMSLFVGGFLCYVLFLQIDEYNKLIITKFKFRFFALRDRLALLVVYKGLAEDSWEYKETVKALNFHISSTEKLSLMRLIEVFSDYHTSPEEERKVERYSRKVDREDVREVLTDFFMTTHSLIRRNSRAQIACILFLSGAIRMFHKEPSAELKEAVPNPAHALNALQSHSNAMHLAHAS